MRLTFATLVLLFVSVLPGFCANRYTTTTLGTLGGSSSFALGVNPAGDAVGASYLSGDTVTHAVLWPAAGGIQDLGTLGGATTYATAINASQQVVGYSIASNGQWHGFFWSASTGLMDLGTLTGTGNSWAYAINSSGQVAGTSTASDGQLHTFTWTLSGGFKDLGLPNGEVASGAQGIDDLGRVVGWATNGSSGCCYDAWAWTLGGPVSLGKVAGGNTAYAFAIDNKGGVTGFSGAAEFPHAFLWSKASGIQDLGTLTNGSTDTSEGFAIALNGQVVGYSTESGNCCFAIIYTKAHGMQDLNTLNMTRGWSLQYAYGVNFAGQVVGEGTFNGATRAFLLTPQ
jgi:probable HAF family extracellular repeat protein